MNPLSKFEYKPLERELLHAIAQSVKCHQKEITPSDELLWIALNIQEAIKLNSYDLLWEAMKELMDKKIIDSSGQPGLRVSNGYSIISHVRMEEKTGVLIVSIPREGIPYYLKFEAVKQPRVEDIKFFVLKENPNL